jgi:mRNA interferase MazF
LVTFERYAVHFVEFPFSDKPRQKGRPALVLTDPEFVRATGNVTVAMITSARHSGWPGDCAIGDLAAAGLKHDSMVRMRFTSIAAPRVGRLQGLLAAEDRRRVIDALQVLFAL